MTARDRQRVRALRDRAARLHRLADDLTVKANTLEAKLAGAPLLGGRRIVDAAVPILTETPGYVMQYKDLLRLVEARSGMRVRGLDPAATMLAALDRDPRVRCMGRPLWPLPPGSQPSARRLTAPPGRVTSSLGGSDPTDPRRIIWRRMILLRHKGTVYGQVDRDQFRPSEWLLRLDAAQEPARSLYVLGQYSAQFFAKHGYSVLVAQAKRHYVPPPA